MNIFVLTGAGVSAESGLPTYRDRDGLWTHIDPVRVATPEAFAREPEDVHLFYNQRRRALLAAAPNAAHIALARLEAELVCRGDRLFLCTQNIDDLHERAGSKRVFHLQGELLKARCCACGAVMSWRCDLSAEEDCPNCQQQGTLRPSVVWFGEMPLELGQVYDALQTADLFVNIGTSGTIPSAAGLLTEAKGLGIRTCEINLKPSVHARRFNESRYGRASEVVPIWAQEVLTLLEQRGSQRHLTSGAALYGTA